MNIADRIQCLRKNKGLSQEELADKVGVSRQAVSKWESGASDPSTSNLSALAKLFGTTAEEILRELKQ